MAQADQQTIATFAKRSDRTVIWLTIAFAVGGAILDIGAHLVSGVFMNGSGFSMLWGMWIPLCFMTIPLIHYLCRRVQILGKQIEELEKLFKGRNAA